MSISFFKPTKKGNGCAVTFSFSCKPYRDKADAALWVNMIKQSGWNDKSNTGVFKDGEKIRIRFNAVEMGAILYSIRNNVPMENAMNIKMVYHDPGKAAAARNRSSEGLSGVRIGFAPAYAVDPATNKPTSQKGFKLTVSRGGQDEKQDTSYFAVGLTLAEATLLEEYIAHCLGLYFKELKSEFPQAGQSNAADDSAMNDDDDAQT